MDAPASLMETDRQSMLLKQIDKLQLSAIGASNDRYLRDSLYQQLAMACALDLLSWGLVITTIDLRVLAQNRCAQELFAAGNGVTLLKNQFTCMDGRTHQKLEYRTRHLQHHTNTRQQFGLRVSRDRNLHDLQLFVIACAPTAHGSPLAQDAPAFCIWIFDPAATKDIDHDLLRDLHGLTATEAQVTACLYRGCTPDETATELRVSINTIKTHLKHIFVKCEVRSQAELLQMLALGPR